MNKRCYVAIVLFFLTVFTVSTIITKAASQIVLTPTSGEPGVSVHVESSEFAASKSVGIGFGAEVTVAGESETVTDTGVGSDPRVMTGSTDKHPIKPGSFRWIENQGGQIIENVDNGNGTFSSNTGMGYASTNVINYTTGFFSSSTTLTIPTTILGSNLTYTTYEFDATPAGLRTDSSGMLSGNFTVPDIWNGIHTVTVIDEAGNVATSDFTVVGSVFIPEALTVGAIVLLSSAAMVVSFNWLRKRSYTKNIA
jgi:hypothetical protein